MAGTPTGATMSTSDIRHFGPEVEEARLMVDQRLNRYLLEIGPGCPEVLSSAMRYSLMSAGKRLRPLLVLAASHVCGGEVEDAMPAACAAEMIHTYSLIHDDLPAMDDDDLRRGQPSCHVQYDEATAILAGDALIPLAFQIISQEVRPAEVAVNCVRELATAAGACHLVGGQSDDLQLQNAEIDIKQLEAIHKRKTGALFTVSLRMGCFCAQASPDQLESLTSYGNDLGLCFQITDDLLDLFGDEVKIGKRTGKDAECGKRTYPGLMGEDASRELARELAERAIASLDIFDEAADDLRRFANFVVDRNY